MENFFDSKATLAQMISAIADMHFENDIDATKAAAKAYGNRSHKKTYITMFEALETSVEETDNTDPVIADVPVETTEDLISVALPAMPDVEDETTVLETVTSEVECTNATPEENKQITIVREPDYIELMVTAVTLIGQKIEEFKLPDPALEDSIRVMGMICDWILWVRAEAPTALYKVATFAAPKVVAAKRAKGAIWQGLSAVNRFVEFHFLADNKVN